ncbi:MAG: Asp-tRNA(Asn)/Glu-tRNA(Gln) amidotransferase subunit GatC [bacterium]|nr:Asp-tRNA(Asn)/Glu-tRNA(Gln) amidotransferase subunit GatC [bacterium]MDZ4231742.1 Asp-tRNA(Asn)/Glu-tRNA(Gln) amidotransferase subunit GatC [Candidatus Pacearchaeota archaeon]
MISKEQVQAIAELSRISLTSEESERMARELDSILEYFAVLAEADTEGVEPMTHAVLTGSDPREDVAEPEDPERVERMIKAMPETERRYLRVPGVLERMKHD